MMDLPGPWPTGGRARTKDARMGGGRGTSWVGQGDVDAAAQVTPIRVHAHALLLQQGLDGGVQLPSVALETAGEVAVRGGACVLEVAVGAFCQGLGGHGHG